MNQNKAGYIFIFSFFFFQLALFQKSIAQKLNRPVFELSFGKGQGVGPPLAPGITNLKYNSRPNDGQYCIANNISFRYLWHRITSDHTADGNGYFMFVNAALNPGTFYSLAIADLSPDTEYNFSIWVLNAFLKSYAPIYTPNLTFTLQRPNGSIMNREVKSFNTGYLVMDNEPTWRQYSFNFRTPTDVSTLVMKLQDNVQGGWGNDFAIDDIVIRPTSQQLTSDDLTNPSLSHPVNDIIRITKLLKTRKDSIVQTITIAAAEIELDFYDNGEMDGDSISVFLNGRLIASHLRLSNSPTTLKVKLDEKEPHQEIAMFAENLGSIPPNTALMIVNTKNKRYDLRLSSSNTTNAVVRFQLKATDTNDR